MNIPDLKSPEEIIDYGMDDVVIRHYIAGIVGGKTLNMEGYTENVLKAGHVIIYDTVLDEYKPMPLSGDAYGSLPANHVYAGVLVRSILTKEPFAAIMYAGEVNDVASPYSVASIKDALKSALPQLVFMHD